MLRGKAGTKIYLSLRDIYESIQGEGLLVGTLSVFLRFQGCNLRCSWCDQPEALEFADPNMELTKVLRIIRNFRAKHVVITGGEPFCHKELITLSKSLLETGYSLQIETNGTIWLEGMEDLASRIHITCSPKAAASFFVNPSVLKYASELKFVVDGTLEEENLLRSEFIHFLLTGRVVLQPEGNKPNFLKKAFELQKKLSEAGYRVRVIPQIHKFLGIP